MGAPKPALGFASRTEAALELKQQGLSAHQIAEKLGISTKNVHALQFSARRTDREDRGTVFRERPDALIPLHIRQMLRADAVKRGVSVDRLISDLVAAIAESDLVDAVLDDMQSTGD